MVLSFCCEEWQHQGKQARETARLRTQKKKMEGQAHLVTKKLFKMVDRWKHKIWTLSDKVEIFTPNPQYSNQCQCGWLAQMHFPSTALDEVEEFSQLLAYIKTVRL